MGSFVSKTQENNATDKTMFIGFNGENKACLCRKSGAPGIVEKKYRETVYVWARYIRDCGRLRWVNVAKCEKAQVYKIIIFQKGNSVQEHSRALKIAFENSIK